MTGLAEAVRQRAGNRCEYCHLPQSAFRRTFHIEHVVARQHGGSDRLDNLALACWTCNLKKGPNLSGMDPSSGRIVPLFQPRQDEWLEHFSAFAGTDIPLGIEIRGLTAIGRTTAQVLGLNEAMRQMIRYELHLEGLYVLGDDAKTMPS
jgi:putative hemolysin